MTVVGVFHIVVTLLELGKIVGQTNQLFVERFISVHIYCLRSLLYTLQNLLQIRLLLPMRQIFIIIELHNYIVYLEILMSQTNVRIVIVIKHLFYCLHVSS